MSILPPGNSSADRPAREYQERLNRPRLPRLMKDAKSDPALSASGYFREFWGPDGICPVQLMGFLKNGEFVYFRARGKKIELEIAATVDGAAHARYKKLLDVKNSELGTGNLPVALCVEYIERWLGDYRTRCGSEDRTYCGAPFELSEAEEAITL